MSLTKTTNSQITSNTSLQDHLSPVCADWQRKTQRYNM